MSSRVDGALEHEREETAPGRSGLLRDVRLEEDIRQVERERVRCSAPGCSRWTMERKPFCPGHVEHMPYVQQLLAEMADHSREQELVVQVGWHAVDVDGATAREVLAAVRQRSPACCATPSRLAIDVGITVAAVKVYLEALERAGFIALRRTRRGLLRAEPVAA